MAKKSKIVTLPTATPVYYACYDEKTRRIIGVTNEDNGNYENKLEIPVEDYIDFVSGKKQIFDYIVEHVGPPGSTTFEVIPIKTNSFQFKNNLLETVSKFSDNSELTVYWNGKNKSWDFSIDANAAEREKKLAKDFKLIFFITLENDYDFLVRTITFDLHQIIWNKLVSIPFVSSLEDDSRKISISTKKHFNSYRLVINE